MKQYFPPLFFALSLGLLLPKSSQATGNDNPTGVTGDYNGSITTAGSYDPYTGNAKRMVDDIIVAGSVGAYPLKWTRVLNTRSVSIGGLGPGGWTHSYQWGMWVRLPDPWPPPPDPYEGPDAFVTYPDGRKVEFYGDPGGTYTSFTGADPGDQLKDLGGDNYDLLLTDGGVVQFRRAAFTNNGITSYAPQAQAIVDPYGQVTLLTSDSAGKLITVREPGGRYLQINYVTYPGSYVFMGSVQAFDGRGNLTQTVSYTYSPLVFYNNQARYHLTTVNYDDGAHAFYTYQPANAVSGSPWLYGLIKTCDDVRYAGPMSKIEYEFMPNGSGIDFGQLKAERNATTPTHQVVSQVAYPPWNPYRSWDDPTGYQRTETRGDGKTRSFQYGRGLDVGGVREHLGVLISYTDFKGQTSFIQYPTSSLPGGTYRTTFIDARGMATHTDRELTAGKVKTVTYPVTTPGAPPASVTYQYVNLYYLSSRRDENGYYTYHDRDGLKRIWQTRYPDGSVEQFSYNTFGQVLTHTLTSGGTENFRYDVRGLKTLSWPPATPSDPNPQDHPTQYFYYTSGPHTDRLWYVVDPRGNATWYEYNLRGQITKVTHQDGFFMQSGYNPDGTLAWTADENHPNASWNVNERTRYTYDEYKRVLTVTNPMNETTTNNYALDWANPLVHTTGSVNYTVSPTNKNVVFGYDENFRKTYQASAAGTADEAWTWFEYDAVGNLSKTTDPRSKSTTFGYDSRNRQTSVTNALNEITSVQYDEVGNKTRETRPDLAFRSWKYDSMNRLWKAEDWRTNATANANQTTTYTRTVDGKTQWTTDTKLAVYEFQYDALGRKTSEKYPADTSGVQRTDKFWYDIAGNLILSQNPAGQYKYFSYDNRNRENYTWWDNWWTLTAGPLIAKTYDAASRLTSVVTNNGETTVAFGYDAANRQVWEDQTLSGSPTRRVLTPRDSDGNRSALQVAGSYLISYNYTQRNQLAHIFDGNNNPFCNFIYDASGNMTNVEMRWVYPNGANFAYDDLNRVTQVEQGNAWQIFTRHHYQYDSVGREVATWRDEDHWLGTGRGERFEYTPTNQLKNAWYQAQNVSTGAHQNPVNTQEYNYTPDMLNRSSVINNGVFEGYFANGLNQYTGVGGLNPTYNDGNFNLTGFNGATYVYGYTSQLISASTGGNSVQFTYDGLGRCVRRVVNGAARIFTYDGWKPMLEWDGAGNWLALNIYGAGPDEILARYDSIGRVLIYKRDKQGNVVALLGNDGSVVEKYSYDAFGKPTVTDNWGNVRAQSIHENRFMFTGREWIKELGIYDYRNRFYHPGLGRFLQADPIGFDAGDMNLFRYCGDDPVDRSDPIGLESLYFDSLEPAIRSAEIRANAAQAHAKSASETLHPNSSSLLGVTVHFVPSQMVPVLRTGNQYEVLDAMNGKPTLRGPARKPYELEGADLTQAQLKRAAALVHIHNNGPGGIARPGNSDLDENLYKRNVVMERRDAFVENRWGRRVGPGKTWYRRDPVGNGKSFKDSSHPDGGKAPTAADVDARHQATGVPGLGQESVNFASGKP